MSHIESKMVEAEVKYLYKLRLSTLLVTHNLQIIIRETSKQKHAHENKCTQTHPHTQI